jgi:hypothetical protein
MRARRRNRVKLLMLVSLALALAGSVALLMYRDCTARATAGYVARLSSGDRSVRIQALDDLASSGIWTDALGRCLVRIYGGNDPELSIRVEDICRKHVHNSCRCLTTILQQGAGPERVASVMLLASMNGYLKEHVLALVPFSKDGDPIVRMYTTRAIAESITSRDDERQLAVVSESCYDSDARVASEGLLVLADRVLCTDERIIGALVHCLGREDVSETRIEAFPIRAIALRALARRGPAARSALPAMIRILEEGGGASSDNIVSFYAKLGVSTVSNYVIDYREDVFQATIAADEDVRLSALMMLGILDGVPEYVVRRLVTLLESGRPLDAYYARCALLGIGRKDGTVTRILADELKTTRNEARRRTCAEIIGEMSANAGYSEVR